MALNHAQKLMATYAKHLDTLNKHRGKGQQKVTVEHVNVAAGGQAIVGNVDAGAKSKASTGDPALEHNPMTPMAPIEPVEKTRSKAGIKARSKRRKPTREQTYLHLALCFMR